MAKLMVKPGSDQMFSRWLDTLSESDRDELARIIAGAEDRWSKIEWGVISDWIEERGGRRSYSLWFDFETEIPGPPSTDAPVTRATIYRKPASIGWEQIECRDVTWAIEAADSRKRHWQVKGQYLRRGARTRRSVIEAPYPSDIVILGGWGHFSPPTPLHDTGFAAVLAEYLATAGATILADFRNLATK